MNFARFRRNIVHDEIVWTRERTAFEILEPSAHGVELREIDTRDRIEIADGLKQRARGERDMWLHAHESHVFFVHVAGKREHRTAWGTHQNIRARAAGA